MSDIWKRTEGHVFIAGTTGGGKTVTGNEAQAEYDGLSIFWNSEEESNIVGRRAESPSDIIELIHAYGWGVKVDYRPSSYTQKQMIAEFDILQKFIFDLADSTGRKHPIQVIVDECQDLAEEGRAESGLHIMIRKGRKRNIKCIIMSQDPAKVSKVCVRQCKFNLWCGEFNPYYEDYMDNYNLPKEVFKEQEQTYYTVMEKAKVVSKFNRASKRYA